MFRPDVLAHPEPEPEILAKERERLLAELDSWILSTHGALQRLLEAMRAVVLSRRPGAVFNPTFAADFAAALEHYGNDTAALKPPPDTFHECLVYLREHLQATGRGPLLVPVKGSPSPSPEESARLQADLRMRATLGNLRG